MAKDNICAHNRTLLHFGKEGGTLFETMWMNLGDRVLNAMSDKKKKKKYCTISLTCKINEFLTAKSSAPFLAFVLLALVVSVVADYFFSETLTLGFGMTFQGTLLSSSWGFLHLKTSDVL